MMWLLRATFVLITVKAARDLQQLTIVGLAPFTEKYKSVGECIKPAVQLALEDINGDKNVLHGYNLTVKWIDTQVSVFEKYKEKVLQGKHMYDLSTNSGVLLSACFLYHLSFCSSGLRTKIRVPP